MKEKLVFMLLVDPDDKLLTLDTLEEIGFTIPIQSFSTSAELFDALKKNKPALILIDYNISPESGLNILKRLKSDENYNSIPIVILTDSPRTKDYEQCYSYGACSVIKKPETTQMTSHKIKTFFDYWMNVAETI